MSAETPVKFDGEKVRFDLIPAGPLEQVARVLQHGSKKYGDYNYLRGDGLTYSRLYAACLRHLMAWWRGEDLDDESGEHHLAHAACCLLMVLHIDNPKNDDRPKR